MTIVHRQCEVSNVAGLQHSNAVPSAMLHLCFSAHNCGALPPIAYSLCESSAEAHGAKPMAVLRMQLSYKLGVYRYSYVTWDESRWQ